MKRKNFGTIKNQVFSTLLESFSQDDTNVSILTFSETIKNNPFLTLESILYKNLENKCIKNENSAARYIDECISLFQKYNKEDYFIAHGNINSLEINESVSIGNKELYNHIDTLLFESLSITDSHITDVDSLHESYEFVLNHVMTNQPKIEIKESKFDKIKSYFSKEDFLKKSIENYNQKFSDLNESEKKVVSVLTSKNLNSKIELFEGLKDENTKYLMKKLASNTNDLISEKVKKSIDKITKMTIDEKNINKDILNLYNLKSNMQD